MKALEIMISASGEKTLAEFIDKNMAPKYIEKMSRKNLLDLVQNIRRQCAQAGDIMAEPVGDHGVILHFVTGSGRHTVQFEVSPSPPHRIIDLAFEQGESSAHQKSDPFAWNTLESQLEKEAAAGFAGTILVIRDGEIFLHKGFGLANRKLGISNTTETVFAIGSTPIDFTKAAVLKLEDMGLLKTSDPISKFFSQVPEDKRAITIDHLMQSSSGLPNFHHIPDKDGDYDLTWIDRDEAVRRILGKELLFPPGQGEAHSHSAWTLLAAVVEVASKQTYYDFLREHFFQPLGMLRTGGYEHTKTFDGKEIAVGYGSYRYGKINTPAHWGKTSWLVMGSGGMVSTPGDLRKWVDGIRSGGVLSETAQKNIGWKRCLQAVTTGDFSASTHKGPGR
jgi:CubicO group peptidase (beta-lactamase class C family)